MIKPVDEIPQNVQQSRKSYRENIRQDIREAIDRDIGKFEFVGDYKYKYLAQYAREEARRILFDIARERFRGFRGDEEIYLSSIDLKTEKYIRISSVKGETPDKTRVFCRIDLSGLDEELLELVKKKVAENKAYLERRRAKLKMEANDKTESFDFSEELT